MNVRPAQPVYPICLTNLAGAPVVVIGGGPVAARKVAGLLAVQAAVTIVSPALTPELALLAAMGRVYWINRPYVPGDLAGARLAFAATDVRAVNAQVAGEAAQRGLLCNVADAPEEGSFHLPAVHRQAELVVAVSTGGTAPGRARRLRDRIAAWLAATPTDAPAKEDRGLGPRSSNRRQTG
ncbi:MAG: bifunctional precorrin-2 dehydrogenase/sirohydrochlorin ferrochelatase [Caldilineaceae bacterium]|nr:bifunctional precorrin-2 dehydrogenase/sirohydrochlorin ferrochelatase [Caldilineaceae bacterium]